MIASGSEAELNAPLGARDAPQPSGQLLADGVRAARTGLVDTIEDLEVSSVEPDALILTLSRASHRLPQVSS